MNGTRSTKALLGFTSVMLLTLLSGCALRDSDAAPAMMTNFAESRPLAGEEELRVLVHFRIGNIIVSAAPENTLYKIDADYDSVRYKPDLQYNPGARRLDFRLDGERGVAGSGAFSFGFGNRGDSMKVKNRLNLMISPKVRLRLELTAGVGETKLNLAGLQTESLELESGVSSTFISCDTPNPVVCDRLRFRAGVGEFDALQLGNLHFRSLDFQGGVGSSRLDFSGQWVENADVSIQMGVGELQVKLPSQIGAEVETQKKFLSGLHLEAFTQRGGSYFSDNYDSATRRVRFRMQTGIGSIKVTWL